MTKPDPKADPRFDRLCESFRVTTLRDDPPWKTSDTRGALNLEKDGSAHRKFHSFYEDLLN
ncbi:hypothetical protein FIU86_02680 [Roseovarius sp. THAF9]|uniref:hypothetical protein n=1 Tax=Roseovarius sp. THAF9 TaxID=2587847 RepID=UPI001267C33D|nr:hypothetical protein [Roseovarius sp. THAF9]QFT91731.1 hypothetical protein FIU86_02680 [Roseovarius sp. THAF9]